VERFSSDDSKVLYYTGFPDYSTLKAFDIFIEPHAGTMVQSYGRSENNLLTRRPTGSMQVVSEMFMFLVRLKLGLQVFDLADRFKLNQTSVSTKLQN